MNHEDTMTAKGFGRFFAVFAVFVVFVVKF